MLVVNFGLRYLSGKSAENIEEVSAVTSMKAGSRHPLLFYRHSMDRIWKSTLVLAIVLGLAGVLGLIRPINILGLNSDVWLIATAALALMISIFAFLARYLAYIQPMPNVIKIVTPFLRFQISYRRMRGARPLLVQQVFPKDEASWSQRSFLDEFYGKTAIILDLKGFPLNQMLLRLFLPALMFSPQSTGLVLVVPDWMKLSTEIDSMYGAWLQIHSQRMKSDRA